MINSNSSENDYTGFDSPCMLCKRKDCTMTVFFGKTCEFATYVETKVSGYEPYKPKPYVKKQKNKKRVYRRGKF